MQPSLLDDPSQWSLTTVLCLSSESFRHGSLILLGTLVEHNQELREVRSHFNSWDYQRRLHLCKNIQLWDIKKMLKYCELLRAETAWLICLCPASGKTLIQCSYLTDVGWIKMKLCQHPVCESVLGVSSLRWSMWFHKSMSSSYSKNIAQQQTVAYMWLQC